MASPNQDSLLAASKQEKSFMVPKNLIIVTGVVLILLVIIVFAGKSAMDDTSPAQLKLKPQASNTAEPASELFDNTIREQKAKGQEQAKADQRDQKPEVKTDKPEDSKDRLPMPTPINGAGFPEVGKNGEVQLPPVVSTTGRPSPQATRESDMAAREMMIRDSKILAIDSDTDSGKSSHTSSAASDEIANQQNELQSSLQKLVNPSTGLPVANGTSTSTSRAKAERDWMKESAQLSEGHEVSRGYAPPSRFMLMQGKTINAVLRNAINTDLPGEIQATVLADIYDSISGQYMLIPKGSTLVGVYNSDVRVGQDRVNMAFKRLILPNGISVNLPGNIGMDSSGMSGVPGNVNNHYPQMFLVSTLTALGAYGTQRTQQASSGTTVNTAPQQSAAGQILIDMNNAVLERNRVIGPTITIPAGIRIAINVARDIELPPYKK